MRVAEHIGQAVAGILTTIVIAYLAQIGRRPARIDPLTNARVLLYSRTLRFFVAFNFLIFSACVFGSLVSGLPPVKMILATSFMGACAFWFGLMLVETWGIRVEFTDRSITGHSPWHLPRTIEWMDVIEVRYSQFWDGFLIRGGCGETIHASRFLVGVGEFASAMRSQIRPQICGEAMRKFHQHRSF